MTLAVQRQRRHADCSRQTTVPGAAAEMAMPQTVNDWNHQVVIARTVTAATVCPAFVRAVNMKDASCVRVSECLGGE